MIYLILAITGIIAAVLVRKTWSLTKQVVFILFALGLCLILFFSIKMIAQSSGNIDKGGSSFLAQIPWIEIVLYFCMILGMAGKYFFDAIGTGTKKKIVIHKWLLVKPLFISPLVFGAIYVSIEKISSVVLLLVFAFQNGFFWQSVLSKSE